MTLLLTKKEWEYIVINPDGEYAFECAINAPPAVKKKIENQLKAHKEWLGLKTNAY